MDNDCNVEINVLAMGNTFLYVILRFPIFKTTLQEVKLQWEEPGGAIHVFDGFARECELLDCPLPAVAKIMFSYENAFIIEELSMPCMLNIHACILYIVQGEEFKRCININGYQLYEGDKVFVMWNWVWLEEIHSSNDDSRSNDLNVIEEFKDDSDDTSDDDSKVLSDITSITHSVILKCIGNLKEHHPLLYVSHQVPVAQHNQFFPMSQSHHKQKLWLWNLLDCPVLCLY